MAEIAGLMVRQVASRRPTDETRLRELALMRTAALSQGRRIHRYVERLCSHAIALQATDRLDRLFVADDPWSSTGPSVASSLRPLRNPHLEDLRRCSR